MSGEIDVVAGRWPDTEAFYRERDLRTGLEVQDLERYALQPVQILVNPAAATELTTQRIALVAANLTARWARRVQVVVPEVPLCNPLQACEELSLGGRILREMRSADPFGSFEVCEGSDRGWRPEFALRLFVGPWTAAANLSAEDYQVDACGWVARGCRGGQRMQPPVRCGLAPAAALAAAIGAGDLFKRAIGHPSSHWLGRFEWSTWSHAFGSSIDRSPEPPSPAVADVGRVLLAGAGAIGSALLYILLLGELDGDFTVLDRDCVDTSNLNRSPLFAAADAALARHKTAVATGALRGRGVSASAVEGTWHEHGLRLSEQRFDAWVSLTNEDAAWAEVPYQLPPVVIHGTTTSGWGVAFGRHIPRLEDCTLCRLPRPHAEFRGPCSQGEVRETPAGDGPRASLPFLSTVAASLVAAELMKLSLPGAADQPNAVQADFRRGLPRVLAMSRVSTPGCPGCRMAHMDLWDRRGGRSRYRGLSEPAVAQHSLGCCRLSKSAVFWR
jgi:hypothetical protein